MRSDAPIERVEAAAYRIPTEKQQADGTSIWSSTTLVVVHVTAAGHRGLGYSYGSATMAPLIRTTLAERVRGIDALDVVRANEQMVRAVRTIGRPGIAALAISAGDAAVWGLQSRLLGLPLVALLGAVRDGAPIYASGGFTNLDVHELEEQLRSWIDAGIPRVKMKVGARPDEDVARVAAAREAIDGADLMVDASGAYDRKQASAKAAAFADHAVVWFEEPVPSEDLDGLRLLRDRAPGGMAIACGGFAFDAHEFRRILAAGAVDVLLADATRCLGISGFL